MIGAIALSYPPRVRFRATVKECWLLRMVETVVAGFDKSKKLTKRGSSKNEYITFIRKSNT